MAAGAIRAGRAFVELTTDDSGLQAGLRRAQARFRAFGASVQRVGAGMSTAGAAVLAPLLAATRQFGVAGDQLDKMSARTGIAVETLSELKFAAEQSGASVDDLGKLVQSMNRRMGRITSGQASASQVDALKELGVNLDEIEKMNPEQRFLAIADAMKNYGDDAAAAGLAQRVFSTQVDKLLPLLQLGKDGINGLRQEARDAGLVISTDMASSAAEMQDAMNKLTQTVRAATLHIGAALAPAITQLSGQVQELMPRVLAWIKRNDDLIVTIAKVAAGVVAFGGGLIALGTALRSVGVIIGVVATALKGLAAVMTFVAAHPLVLAIGAIVVAMGLLIAAFNGGEIAGVNLGNAIGGLIARLNGVHRATLKLVDANEQVVEAQNERKRAEAELEGASNEEERIAALKRLRGALEQERQAMKARHREQQRERRARLDEAREAGDGGRAQQIQRAMEHADDIADRNDRRRRERIRGIGKELEQMQPGLDPSDLPDVSDLQDDLDGIEAPNIDDIEIDAPELGDDLFSGFEKAMRSSDLGEELGRKAAGAAGEIQRRHGAFASFSAQALAGQFFGSLNRGDRKESKAVRETAENTASIDRQLQRQLLGFRYD